MLIDETKIYEESCAAFRHYSNAVMTIRTLTFAQGFVILTATGFLVRNNEQALSIVTILFGLSATNLRRDRLQNQAIAQTVANGS